MSSNTTPARGVRPRWMLVTSLALLAVFVAFGFAVAVDPSHPITQPLDDAWRAFIGAHTVDEISGPLPMFFQEVGQIGGAVFALLLVVWLFVIRRWRSALFLLAAELVGSFVVSQLVKNLVDRPRPEEDLAAGLSGPLLRVDHGSFPSGHGVTMGILIVAIAALLPLAWRRVWWIISVVLALGMIWQRTFINAHWISDAIAGVIGGIGITLLVWWIFAPMLERDRGRPLFRSAKASTAAPTSPITEGA